ncbi:DNA polymerase III subunit gamma/tau [Aquirufa regiilacus]|uniref:DNA polymerase III subunit gamma/tau n=1 Tax=Aquirufa regiilacus TaxID=3024868 RepID=A0ABU3TPD1_9BACT|nr:DNA polymerase III subunit gamma/tau [Aquirufa sp. LEOWEIH-7C]MDU0807724.1 DNA polymerase III subunit gamma/tau [Aquirufa sp. LEOWEIH-7C]
MENFIVSARKYRPTQFDSVVGQSHITTTLKNAIKSNHLAQAFLFCGPRGVGKTTCARILAKTINCENIGNDGEACGTCPSCQSFQDNTSLTIHELDAASNNSVDDIRNLIDQVRYPPQRGRYKIYIIDEVHMLSAAAFNAFLKTLEEPPSYAIFILATTEKHKILPTILSRCQIFDFNRIQWKDMADHLANIAQKENIQAEPSALELIAIKADGGLRDALSMFDLNVTFSTDNALRHKDVLENLHILDSDYYVSLTNHLIQQNHVETLVLLDEIMRKGFDGQQFISGFMEHLRNLLFAKDPQTLALMEISDETRAKFKQQAELTSTSFLLSAMNICSTCESNYKSAKNARLHLELCLLKINYLPSVYQLATEGGTGKKPEPQAKSAGATTQTTVSTPPAIEVTAAPVTETPVAVSEPAPATVPTPAPTPAAEEPKPQAKPVTQIPAAGLSGLRSSKSVIKPKAQEDEVKEQAVANDFNNQDFDSAKLLGVWNEIAQKFKDANLINKFVMMDRPIELIDTVAHIKVENEVQVQHFNEQLRMEVLGTLRERLQNYAIDIVLDVTIQENGDKKLLYTQSDKYDFLVQKHPILGELKQKLGLDHEF